MLELIYLVIIGCFVGIVLNYLLLPLTLAGILFSCVLASPSFPGYEFNLFNILTRNF